MLEHDFVYKKSGTYYCMLTRFKKSYGKWRYEQYEIKEPALCIHAQELEFFLVYSCQQKNISVSNFWILGITMLVCITSENLF